MMDSAKDTLLQDFFNEDVFEPILLFRSDDWEPKEELRMTEVVDNLFPRLMAAKAQSSKASMTSR